MMCSVSYPRHTIVDQWSTRSPRKRDSTTEILFGKFALGSSNLLPADGAFASNSILIAGLTGCVVSLRQFGWNVVAIRWSSATTIMLPELSVDVEPDDVIQATQSPAA